MTTIVQFLVHLPSGLLICKIHTVAIICGNAGRMFAFIILCFNFEKLCSYGPRSLGHSASRQALIFEFQQHRSWQWAWWRLDTGREGCWGGRNPLWEQQFGEQAGAVPCCRLLKLPPRLFDYWVWYLRKCWKTNNFITKYFFTSYSEI